jgi:pimeloyl-ACP methyl ester carboxylesterase
MCALWRTHTLSARLQTTKRTRPQTLAYGLNDSPLGLAAWILEKFFAWSDPATRPLLRPDDLITNVMLYWVSQTIASSVRLYALPRPPFETIKVPTAVLLPHEPNLAPPESWLRRAYPDLRRLTIVDRGGHFLALENPELLVNEIRDAFRPFRRPTASRGEP